MQMKNKLKNKTIQYAILIASIGYIIFFFIGNKNIFQTTFQIDLKILVSILILQLIFLFLQSWRFQIMIQKCSLVRPPLWSWFKIFILGRFLNLIFTQIGNLYRSVQLKSKYGISHTRYVSVFTSMAWIDTCMNLMIAFLVILLTNVSFQIGQLIAWKAILIIFTIIFFGPVILEILLKKIRIVNHRFLWLQGKLSEVLNITLVNTRPIRFFLVKCLVLVCYS